VTSAATAATTVAIALTVVSPAESWVTIKWTAWVVPVAGMGKTIGLTSADTVRPRPVRMLCQVVWVNRCVARFFGCFGSKLGVGSFRAGCGAFARLAALSVVGRDRALLSATNTLTATRRRKQYGVGFRRYRSGAPGRAMSEFNWMFVNAGRGPQIQMVSKRDVRSQIS
jgi:hypothetical protein